MVQITILTDDAPYYRTSCKIPNLKHYAIWSLGELRECREIVCINVIGICRIL